MAQKSDTRIHQTELLITLDYLLNFTDENHPATQQAICKHARNFGLKYDPKATKGNDVRRQRIADCLEFLKEISNNWPDKLPFILETTREEDEDKKENSKGKYYIEQRNGLSTDQVAEILAAIKNDKYTKDSNIDLLMERVLGAFSTNDDNRKIIDMQYKRLIRGVKKFDKNTIKKINLFEEAYREGEIIKVGQSVNNSLWYKIYLIKEFHNKLYAFMLPISRNEVKEKDKKLSRSDDYIFDAIENINIPNFSKKSDVIIEDIDNHRDIEQLFKDKCPKLAKKYGSLDEFLEKAIIPNRGKTCIVSFYFNLSDKDILKRSYQGFFYENFRYQETNFIGGIENELEGLRDSMDNWVVVMGDAQNEDAPKKYGVANISVDNNSFLSWLISDPIGDGMGSIADMITIIKPLSINNDLANYYYRQLFGRTKYLRDGYKSSLIRNCENELNANENSPEVLSDEKIIEKLNESLLSKQSLHLYGNWSRIHKIVKIWMEENEKNNAINPFYLIAPTMKVFFKEKENEIDSIKVVGQIFASNEIDMLEAYPNRVVMIDHAQFFDENQKKHMSLLEKGYVVDIRENNGYKKLTNILFVCLIDDPNFK